MLEDYGNLLSTDDEKKLQGSEGSSVALATYIDMIVKLAFGFGSIAAVALIVMGGIKYVTSNGVEQKLDSKSELGRAIGALAILFTSFLLFNTLNPELLKVRFKPLTVEGTVDCSGSFCGAFDDVFSKSYDELKAQG